MLGYAEEALIDRIPVTEIVGPQHRAKVKDVIRSLTPGSNQRFQYTACLTRRDGTSVDVEVYSRAIDFADQPASIGVVIDVSERNRAMEDLRNLALRLQSVREEERTRIARDIHDDLGQKMTALKLQISWLEKQAPPECPAMFIEKLAAMKQLANSAIQSVHDVLDINLPDRNGFDLLQDIQRSQPHLPVLFLTMHPEEILAVRAMHAGAKGYLCKDSSSEELVKALRKLAAGGVYVSASLGELLAPSKSAENAKSCPTNGCPTANTKCCANWH